MWINYHHLYYFKTIAEEQSVSKAATKLRLGQPTLSAQLKQFEDVLAVKLFDRKHKRLLLTEQGKIALEYAQNIFRMGDEMLDTLHDRRQPDRYRVQLGALDGIPKGSLTDISLKILKSYPSQVLIKEGPLEMLMKELFTHKLDLIVSNYLPRFKDGFTFTHRLVKKSELRIFGSAQYKTLKKGFPESLRKQPFILSTYDSKTREEVEEWFNSVNVEIDVIVETQDIALKKQLALRGLGLISATLESVEHLVEQNELFEIGHLSGIAESIYFISSQRKISNPPAQYLMDKFEFDKK